MLALEARSSRLVTWLSAKHVVMFPLTGIAQTLIGLSNFLKRVSCRRCSVPVWMHFQSKFAVCFLDVVVRSTFLDIKNLVEVGRGDDLLGRLLVLRGELWLLRLLCIFHHLYF